MLLLASTNTSSQVLDFSNKKPKIIAVPYDSTYYVLPEYGDLDVYEGLLGQRLVDSEGEIWTLKDYVHESGIDIIELKVQNPKDQKIKRIDVYDFQEYYIEAGFEKYKSSLVGKNLYPVISEDISFAGYNDIELLIHKEEVYKITDIRRGLFENDEYAPVVEINNQGYYKLIQINDGLILKGNAKNHEVYFRFDTKDNFYLDARNTGVGDYDGSGDGVFGRKIIKRNWRGLFAGGNHNKWKGSVAVKVCVDRSGKVQYSEIIFDETTETDRDILKRALEAAKGYKYQANKSAPKEQCGKLVFNLSKDAIRGNR